MLRRKLRSVHWKRLLWDVLRWRYLGREIVLLDAYPAVPRFAASRRQSVALLSINAGTDIGEATHTGISKDTRLNFQHNLFEPCL
jgi:hypothetical protein